jgi:hypothetical protein
MIPKEIIIHHSASNMSTPIAEIDRWHKQRGFNKSNLGFYVGYHFVILVDGKIIQTRSEYELGCHTIPNDGKIGICVVGNFEIDKPSIFQINSLTRLCEKLKKMYNISEIKGHRDFNKTACPGKNLYLYVLKDRLNFLQKLLNIIKGPFKFHV